MSDALKTISVSIFRLSLIVMLFVLTNYLRMISMDLNRIANAAEIQRTLSMSEAIGPDATERILGLNEKTSPALKDTE